MVKQNMINILIVDDNQSNITVLKAILVSDEYVLMTATSGEEALKYVLKYDFAVILLDVQMPNLNGYETAKLIKQRENSKHTPIIFITAFNQSKKHISEGYLSGAVDYIFKPFNPEILKSKVQTFVLLYKKQKEIEQKHNKLEDIICERTKEFNAIKEYFQTIFHFTPNLMAIRSFEDKKFININQSWCDNTGYKMEDIIEETGNILKITLNNVTHCSDHNSPDLTIGLVNENVTFVTKEHETRYGLLSTKLVTINNKSCVISSITDVTEKHHLELAISRLDRLNLVGEMAAGIAHEIRNPMTTVLGFLQLAKNEPLNHSPNNQYIDIMLDELKRANDIISEFLTLAKNKSSHLKKTDINEIIRAIYPLLQADAFLTNHEIKLDLNDCPLLLLDEKEIRQLILNIGKNGIQAMDHYGVLTIRTYEQNQYVKLEISDQGSGIPSDIVDKIGTPFFTTKDEGTGLGMAICYSICARHGAELDFSTSSNGTTFTVTFQIE